MKTFLKIFALISMCTSAFAEPSTLAHQGLLTSPGGTPLDTVVSVTFKLYNNFDSPTPFWSEIQSVTVSDGLYNVALGTVTPFPGDFLNDGTSWLGITVGADAEMLPRMQLRSVPFSFRVGTVDDASGGDITSDVLIRGKLTVGNFNSNTGTQSFVSGNWNSASGDYATCLGHNNYATGYHSTVSGGQFNFGNGDYSVIAGGGNSDTVNGNFADGTLSTIGGGYHNYATGDASTIAGGYYHTASGGSATIGGGYRNTATTLYSTVGGGTYNNATGQYSTIAGGRHNGVEGNRSSIGGGDMNDISSGSEYSTIAGGHDNHISGDYSSIAGGDSNAIWGSSNYATIGGGRVNQVTGQFSGVLSGRGNRVTGTGSVICGGDNQAWADSSNRIESDICFIGGGVGNTISSSSRGATISGGSYNSISSAANAVIGGGLANDVDGISSTVPGGYFNHISGNSSFACGMNTNVTASNAFVFGDGTEAFSIGSSYTANFLVNNGFRIWTDNPVSSNIGVRVVGGGTSWISLCDSTTKMNRSHADGVAILEKLATMPIDQWNYKHQPDGPKHIGPMAQDFWNAFQLGTDSLGIETLDADGVALAAIQELAKRNQELEDRVKHLEAALLQYGVNSKSKSE